MLLALIERRRIDVGPERVFSLEEVSAAHAYLEGSSGFGKVVVTV